MAIEEINAKGGVQGRELKHRSWLWQTICWKYSICYCSLYRQKVHAISNAFTFAPIPGMDTSAKWKAPYLQGNTQRLATEEFKRILRSIVTCCKQILQR